MRQFKISSKIGKFKLDLSVNSPTKHEAETHFMDMVKDSGANTDMVHITEIVDQGEVAGHRVSLAKGSTISIAFMLLMLFSSCGTSNSRGVRVNDGLFYKGYVIKSNGERKSRVFVFGKDACKRKNERIRKRRSRINNPDRHPGYGITSMGRARQRH